MDFAHLQFIGLPVAEPPETATKGGSDNQLHHHVLASDDGSLDQDKGVRLQLDVHRDTDLLVRLSKAPDGRVIIPELEDFELVNRTHNQESGSIAWFLNRAIRNLEEARQARGFDFSGTSAGYQSARDAGIQQQIQELRDLRSLKKPFTWLVEDPSGESKLIQPSDAVVAAHIKSLTLEFGECEHVPVSLLRELNAKGVASYVRERKPKVIVMLGAGASTSAGIPDFRTPGTGLYDNLQAYNLPYPTAVFELGFFRRNPQPFFTLVKEIWPGNHKPTSVHHFVRRLHEEGLLLRCYTQNIDGLERIAGVPEELLVEAHGHFRSAHGVDTYQEVPIEDVKAAVFEGGGPQALKSKYGELVKPDITFFGEPLPVRFGNLMSQDFRDCELLFVVGTSLKVAPFNGLIGCVPSSCPRVLINREAVGLEAKNEIDVLKLKLRHGFRFEENRRNTRDVFLQGTCDEGVELLSAELCWAI